MCALGAPSLESAVCDALLQLALHTTPRVIAPDANIPENIEHSRCTVGPDMPILTHQSYDHKGPNDFVEYFL